MYFVYVDESGTPGWSQNTDEYIEQQKRYFVMAGIMIHSSHILDVERAIMGIKQDHGLGPFTEVKWHTKYAKIGLALEELVSYRSALYDVIEEHAEVIVGSVMDKPEAYKKPYINDHFDVYKNSLLYIMERIHYYLVFDIKKPELTIFVLDSRKNEKNRKLDKMLAEAYRMALALGTYYTDFKYFSQTAFFSDSEDSIGIQLADHCAGPIYRYITENKNDWYSRIRPKIRKPPGKPIEGYGIKVFP